jgi:hypothetical protein
MRGIARATLALALLSLLALVGFGITHAPAPWSRDAHAYSPAPASPPDAWPELVLQLGHPQGSEKVAFSPDGRYLATFSGRPVKLWVAATGELLRTLTGEREPATAPFKQDGFAVAAESDQSPAGGVVPGTPGNLTITAGRWHVVAVQNRVQVSEIGWPGRERRLWEADAAPLSSVRDVDFIKPYPMVTSVAGSGGSGRRTRRR